MTTDPASLPLSAPASLPDSASAMPAGTAPTASAPPAAAPAAPAESTERSAPQERKRRSTRGGRNRRPARPGAEAAAQTAPAAAPAASAAPVARRQHPLLDQLAQWHPQLFGAQLLPLKRGIFHDLLAAHGPAIDKDALKQALALHTRSTRYLNAVAQGQQRHDLSGQPVEALAPEHIHHALLEVFRRRKPRDGEDLTVKLRRRLAQAFEASGLTREAYDSLVRGRDERANTLLDQAFAEVAERDARAEALLRAFTASGSTPEQFADMYGMHPREVARQLERARKLPNPA
ncbi:hypothetical protein MASR1M59_03030 [Melaminivora sp.]